jgi:hypothetical protein
MKALLLLALLLSACTTTQATTNQPEARYSFEPLGSAGNGGSKEPARPPATEQASAWTSPTVPPSILPSPATTAPAPRSTPKASIRPCCLVPPVLAARGLVTWQPISGYRASPGPLIRSWGVRQGEALRVCNLQSQVGKSITCVRVTVFGWCACGDRPGGRTLLDLSSAAFARLAPLSAGVISVEVER